MSECADPAGRSVHEASPDGPGTSPPPAPTVVERRSWWRSRVLAGTTLVAVALGAGTAGAEIATNRGPLPAALPAAAAAPVAATTTPTQPLAKVAAAVQPSVVSIVVQGQAGSSEGSGVILRADGTILTNNHVIAGAASGGTITVKLADGRSATANIVGRDPGTDLAVISVRGVTGLTPARLGSSASVHVGDTVLAVGSPLGLEGSVSAGIVSALHRPVALGGDPQGQTDPFGAPPATDQTSATTLSDAIQTDAPINPGNSGGPLVDTSGRIIGINTAIATLGGGMGGQSGNIGVGFAIPVDDVAKVAEQLIRGEKPTHAVLGVQASDAQSGGAVVGKLTPSSPAAAAGLRAGDVITAVNGEPVRDAAGLATAVRAHRPGDRVRVTFLRNGATRTATATLGSTPS